MGLFEHKIKQFPDVIDWVKGQDVALLSEYLATVKPKLFMGSGGSFSACTFGELLSASRGVMSHALTPYFYIKSGFGSLEADTLLISASGGNRDIARAFDKAYANTESDVAAITLQSEGMLHSRVPSFVPSLRIRTEFQFPLGAIDLLIKEHYLCSALGERWGLDISNPEVPDYGRELHSK